MDLCFCQSSSCPFRPHAESYLDSFGIKLKAVFGDQEFLYIFTLITLELDNFSHLTVGYDGTIAGEFLLDHFEDLLLIKLLG